MKNDILLPGERVIREGTASRTNIEEYATIGGSLILTDLRILFVAFKHAEINCIIPLSSVGRIGDEFDIFCDIPGVVKIDTRDGETYQFSIKKGEKTAWEEAIKGALVSYYERFPQEKTEILEPIKVDETLDEVPEKKPANTRVSNIILVFIVISHIAGLYFEYGFWLFLLIAIGLCYWDESNLHHAGYDTLTLGHACIIPVYLFKRARMTQSGMIYLVFWCITFLISILCTFTTLSLWINILESIQNIINNNI